MTEPAATSRGANGASFWRWVSVTLTAVLLAGAPGYVNLMLGPSRAQVERIDERQQGVLQRLAVAESTLMVLDAEVRLLRTELGQRQEEP